MAFGVWVLLAWTRRLDGGVATVDLRLLDAATHLRSDAVIDVARVLAGVERNGIADVLTVAVVAGLIWFRRFRRLATFALTLLVVQLVATRFQHVMADPRPFGVERLGRWEGYGNPSMPVAHLAVVLLGVVYGFVPDGRRRRVALHLSILLVAAVAFSAVILGVEYPSWALASFGLAYVLGIGAYRLLCPDGAFSVRYGGGRSAHLTLDEARVGGIEGALAEQFGVRVLDIEPFGQGESGGSTPMRVLVDNEAPFWLFAKLYSEQHLRADRLYKLGRTLLYGRLEDEGGFASVRRLVQNEDYYLRVFRDVGAPVIDAYGFVELVPEREFLLVMEFAEGAVELGRLDPPFPDDLVDQGLALIRLLWDNGIAHRDVKPANLLVQDGELRVVDCGFAELRPSPWRQAVDLANMMLCLGLGRDAPAVYERALRFFSPADIAESFAATRTVTIPSQLRALLDADGRDLVERFRELAPRRERVPVQRWSVRRLGLIAATLLSAGLVLWAALTVFVWHDRSRIDTPACPNSKAVLLVAQSASDATAGPLRRRPARRLEVARHARRPVRRSAGLQRRHDQDPHGVRALPAGHVDRRRRRRHRSGHVGARLHDQGRRRAGVDRPERGRLPHRRAGRRGPGGRRGAPRRSGGGAALDRPGPARLDGGHPHRRSRRHRLTPHGEFPPRSSHLATRDLGPVGPRAPGYPRSMFGGVW